MTFLKINFLHTNDVWRLSKWYSATNFQIISYNLEIMLFENPIVMQLRKTYNSMSTITYGLEKLDQKAAVLKKITRRTTTSERKQVFASKSKFQTESVKIEPAFALMQNILPRRFAYVNS